MRYVQIACANTPSSNKVSFRKGITQMDFQIPEMEAYVIPSSIRICGKIRTYKDDAGGDISTTTANMDARTGVYSTFNTVTTRSLRHQTTINPNLLVLISAYRCRPDFSAEILNYPFLLSGELAVVNYLSSWKMMPKYFILILV